MSNPDLEYLACPTSNCGGQWLPASKIKQLRESHATFYCPSGHSQWFPGKSEVEKLRAELEAVKKDRDWWQQRCTEARAENRAERRKQYALKGHITRLKHAS